MTYDIDKDVPIDPNVGKGRSPTYPFDDMEVGDSILVENKKRLAAIRQSAYHYRKKHPEWDFGTVSYKDGTGRLWRTD